MKSKKLIEQEIYKTIIPNKHYLLAVSGGGDSMCLLNIFHELKYQFDVAHVNYNLRADESDADMFLVENFCKKNKIKIHINSIDTKAYLVENKMGIQEGARKIRYDFFEKIIEENKLFALVTAHHLNDQIETVLMNLTRGTGIHGLSGMKASKKINKIAILRPLLKIAKGIIEDYLITEKIDFRNDSSNSKNDYTRNAIRNQLLPLWYTIDNRFEKSIIGTLENIQASNEIYQKHITQQLSKVMSQRGNDVYIAINALKKLQPSIQWIYEIIKDYNFSFETCKDVLKLINAQAGKWISNEKFKIIRYRDFLIITKNESIESDIILIQESTKNVSCKDFQISISKVENCQNISTEINFATLNFQKLEFPLILRKWKEGDYFYPLGMTKKKKLSKFLKDEKVPLHTKEKIWVVESNQKIIWVVGMRIDERYKAKLNFMGYSLNIESN